MKRALQFLPHSGSTVTLDTLVIFGSSCGNNLYCRRWYQRQPLILLRCRLLLIFQASPSWRRLSHRRGSHHTAIAVAVITSQNLSSASLACFSGRVSLSSRGISANSTCLVDAFITRIAICTAASVSLYGSIDDLPHIIIGFTTSFVKDLSDIIEIEARWRYKV